MMELTIRYARADEAEGILRLTQASFASQGSLDPPSGVFLETVDSVLEAMTAGVVYVAEHEGELVGAARVRPIDDPRAIYCGRLAVRVDVQNRGVGHALMAQVERHARAEGYPAVVVGVRLGLPRNLRFFQKLGFRIISEHSHAGHEQPTYVRLCKDLDPPVQGNDSHLEIAT